MSGELCVTELLRVLGQVRAESLCSCEEKKGGKAHTHYLQQTVSRENIVKHSCVRALSHVISGQM